MMKVRTFKFVIGGLALVFGVGYLLSWNRLFLAGLIIFGVWSLVNVVELLFFRSRKGGPIRMVNE